MKKYKEFRPTQFDAKGLNAEKFGIGEYLVVPVSHTRDSGPLDESNFAVSVDMLGGESEDVQVHRFRHWGPGWFEIILVNLEARDKVAVAEGIEANLADYPVLDEEDFSRREWEAIQAYWDSLGMSEKARYCAEANESIFAARVVDFGEFAERAPRAAKRIEESGRE